MGRGAVPHNTAMPNGITAIAPEPSAARADPNGTVLPTVAPLRIGSLVVDPPILQAPMAGYTNYAFRQIVRGFGGAGLLATEMVNARGFVWLDEQEATHPDRLWGSR